MGGMVACEWATRYPGELRSVVLVNSSLRGISRFTQRLRPSAWPSLLRLVCWPASDERWERTIHRLTSTHAERRDAVVAEWIALRRARPVSRANALRQLLAAARYSAPQEAPAVPLLVLSGAGDRLVDPVCSRRLAQRWAVQHLVHATAGHDMPLDEPLWLIDTLQTWAGGLDSHAPVTQAH
jgi:pimeloyl-ACP methyl ester carboxylesterase